MRFVRNITVRFNKGNRGPPSPTVLSEDILLAQMEIFIIVIAVIAVAAALILLVLLQIRIKKQACSDDQFISTTVVSRAPSSVIEEIAVDYPNDPYLKTGPPPYRQVMKSPELYPLSPTSKKGCGDVTVQITPSSNERTRNTWNQFLNVILRTEDHGLNTPSGKRDTGYSSRVVQELHNSSTVDDVLPTYYEVCSEVYPEPKEHISETSQVEYCQKTFPRCESVVKSEHKGIIGFNFGVEKTKLCQKDCVFTISTALQTVIKTEELMSSPKRPRLATL